MASVNGAKDKYSNNTTEERFNEGLEEFVEESNEDNLQDAWEAEVEDADYTGGVEEFLESEGSGISDADVQKDYDWQSMTLQKGSDWQSQTEASSSKYDQNTGSDEADLWFNRYADSFSDE